MSNPSARRALTDSAISLVLACAAIATLLPPLAHGAASHWAARIGLGLVAAWAVWRHWQRLALAMRLLGLAARPWLALAVMLFPVGGAAVLILLMGHPDRRSAAVALR